MFLFLIVLKNQLNDFIQKLAYECFENSSFKFLTFFNKFSVKLLENALPEKRLTGKLFFLILQELGVIRAFSLAHVELNVLGLRAR